jgi:hypothetical protein
VVDSCAQFSSSEVFNDSGDFSESAAIVRDFFGGVTIPGKVSGPSVSPPHCSGSKGIA